MNSTGLTRRPIRFGLQITPAVDEVGDIALAAEAAGFDVVSVPDHIGPRLGPPIPLLAQIASATTRIKIGTLVLNNDMRNPVQLAWEVAWLQNTSGGRIELGLGAGHTPHEYRATGFTLDHPKVRKARLAESVEIVAALFRGETVDHRGEHFLIEGATIDPPKMPIPILVGGNGDSLLDHAARHVDIIGLQGLGRIRSDGHRHGAKFDEAHLEQQLQTIAAGAATRPDGWHLELNALVQVAEITDDREAALTAVAERIEGVSYADLSRTPYLAVGSVNQLAQQFIAARDRWGISYFTVRNPDWGPVIAAVRHLDDGGGGVGV